MTKKQRKEYNDFIVKTVHTLKEEGKFSWLKAAEIVRERFPNKKSNGEQVRSAYRRLTNKSGTKYQAQRKKAENSFNSRGIYDLNERLLTSLKRKQEVRNLASRLGLTFENLLTEITKLELEGFALDKWKENGKSFIKLTKTNKFEANLNSLSLKTPSKEFKMLIIGDTHIGHKLSQIDYLQAVIKDAYKKGVKTVLHTGDVVEGHYQAIRPTSIKELAAIGFDDQLDLAYKSFPKLEGLHYYLISGNHDESFNRSAFANPVKTLTRMRDDFTYLGHNFAKITLNDNSSIDFVLNHPVDGIGENYALKLKQYIDRNKEDRLARFIFMGHYHKFAHLHYKGIDAWVTPSFIHQTDFMASKNLESVVGAILLTINLDDDGNLSTFTPEYYFLD